MAAELEKDHVDVLAQVSLVHMATLSPRGDPHVVPVRFHFDGTFLYLTAPTGSEETTNLRANRRLALLADVSGDARRGFVLQGLGNPVQSKTESGRVWEALEAKYPDSPPEEVRGYLVKVEPVRIVALRGGR